MKIKLRLDDPRTRAVWETVQRASDEVASWPAWKRGEEARDNVPGPVSAGSASSTKR